MEKIEKSEILVVHMAGIVPVAAPPLEFNMPWHDCMMPIAPDYLAVERAVYECALAGCTTIWITCHLGMQPLLRKRIGDYINLEKDEEEKFHYRNSAKSINIFYVPIHAKDREKRDSLGFSALYGADSAFRVCSFLSKWTAPEKYYCAFPYGVSDPEFIKQNKKLLLSKNKVLFSHEGKTVKDGLYTSFTFDADDYKVCRDIIKNHKLEKWQSSEEKEFKKALHLDLNEIFKGLDTKNSITIEYPWFYNIGSWSEYCYFIGSGTKIKRNKNSSSNLRREELITNE